MGLEAGAKIFSEKPIVASIEQTYALAELMGRYGHDRLLVGLVLRYAPLYRDLLAARDAGQLGQIVSVEARMSSALHQRCAVSTPCSSSVQAAFDRSKSSVRSRKNR